MSIWNVAPNIHQRWCVEEIHPLYRDLWFGDSRLSWCNHWWFPTSFSSFKACFPGLKTTFLFRMVIFRSELLNFQGFFCFLLFHMDVFCEGFTHHFAYLCNIHLSDHEPLKNQLVVHAETRIVACSPWWVVFIQGLDCPSFCRVVLVRILRANAMRHAVPYSKQTFIVKCHTNVWYCSR